ncbi:M20 family metallopeptidase [Leucobacter sp. HY1908]
MTNTRVHIAASSDEGIEARLDALINTDQITADTCDLIRGRGENPGGTEGETVRRLAAILTREGATVTQQELAPDRPNLKAVWGPAGGPAVLFLGHSDVVPAGEGWTGDPFEPRMDVSGGGSGAIIGRGATDMKGGLAAVIAACSALARERPDLRLELLCTVDEEDRSRGVQLALASEPARPYLACIVAEPTNLDVVIGCRGASNLRIEAVGASAHAGRPADGVSAIYAASRVVETVRELHGRAQAGPHDGLLGAPTWNVGTIAGGSGTSMVPRVCTVTVDRRTMPGEDPHEILAALLDDARADITRTAFDGHDRVELTGAVDMMMPGFRTDPESPLVHAATSALAAVAVAARVTGWSAACEGGYIAAHHGCSTIILGPGDINTQAHQPDERVEVDDLTRAAQAYARIVLRMVGDTIT